LPRICSDEAKRKCNSAAWGEQAAHRSTVAG